MRRIFTCPASWGRGRPQPGRVPGDDGDADTGNTRPHGGCVRPARPTGPGAMGSAARNAVIFICHRDAMQARAVGESLPSGQGYAWRTHFVSAGP
jgi:hypothetical protein